MRYYDISEEQMMSILKNLNRLEEEFCQGDWDNPVFRNTDIYTRYINDSFIQGNHIESIYYPNLPGDVKPFLTSGMFELEETGMIFADMNIAISKQFNFHFNRLHQMNCFEAVWVLHGKASFYLGEEEISLKEGDMLIHPPQMPYEFRMDRDAIGINFALRNRYIREEYVELFKGNVSALRFFEKAVKREGGLNYILFHAQAGCKKINSLILNMYIEYLWGSSHQTEILNRYFEMIIYQVRRAADNQVDALERAGVMEDYYGEILLYIKKHYRTVSLEQAAWDMNFSQQYIARILRKMGGKSFHNLVEEEKIKKVKEYLEETNYNLEIIAELTGYANGSYLSKVFRKCEGCTVSEYRGRRQ